MRTRRKGRWLLKQPRLGARMCQGTFFFQGEKKMNKVRQLLEESLTGGLYQMTLSGAAGEATGCSKKKIRPVLLKDRLLFQITAYRGTQVFHENHTAEETAAILEADLSGSFKQLQVETTSFEATVLVSKKGKMTVRKKQRSVSEDNVKVSLSHNRKKRYILEEGRPVPFLVDLGVQTKEGKVITSRYDKFRQINRFLEFIEDIWPLLPKDRPVHIIDFGCGKSYLTFAMYYYLHELKEYDIRIIGLDLKKDVIRHCNELSEKYGYEKLRFLEGDIADYTGVNKVDMVVTLHACDTATDYALAKAVGWDAKLILSVPCCQHELNRQIKNEILEPILKYGLLKERMAALITDGLRAQYLEREGYEAQILEFIDMEHTPKNILIRAVKKRHAKEDNNIEASIKRCEAALRVSPTLGRLLDGFATESANSEKDHPEKEDKEGV